MRKDASMLLDIGYGDFVSMHQYFWNLVHTFSGGSSPTLGTLLLRVVSESFAGIGALREHVSRFVRKALVISKESCWPQVVPERTIENASRNGLISWLWSLGSSMDGVPGIEQFQHIDTGMPTRRLCQELGLFNA